MRKLTGKMPRPRSEHLDQTPAYTATARTPGIKDYNIFHNTVEIYIDYIYIYKYIQIICIKIIDLI